MIVALGTEKLNSKHKGSVGLPKYKKKFKHMKYLMGKFVINIIQHICVITVCNSCTVIVTLYMSGYCEKNNYNKHHWIECKNILFIGVI